MPRITQIEIRNFGGIRQLKMKVPPKGVVVKGGNHRGKTSFVNSVAAGLMAEGVDPGAIRQGADKSELFFDLDMIGEFRHVHRTIRPSGQEVVIRNDEDDTRPRPAEYLKGIFGKSINPVSFYLAKADERRKLVLEAMQCQVTREDLERWTGRKEWSDEMLSQNGLVLLKRVRDDYYERRRQANKERDEAEEDARRALVEAEAIEAKIPLGIVISIEDAQQRWDAANQSVLALDARAEAARAAESSYAEQVGKIDRLRRDADAEMAAAPTVIDREITATRRAHEAAQARVDSIKRELELAEAGAAELLSDLTKLEEDAATRAAAVTKATNLREQANDLETNLRAAGAVLSVSEEERSAKTKAREAATYDLATAQKRTELQKATTKATGLKDIYVAAHGVAEDLDRIVTRLTKDAPIDLSARGGTIEGFDAEAMTLDGKALDRLSGEEQLSFAVKLAKRVNPKAKILICDNIERVDDDLLERFLKLATADDWQLIASRVTRGELVFEAIEGD